MRFQLPSNLVPPLVAGVGLAVFATICAELFVPYVTVSTEAWPPEALSILREGRQEGVSVEDKWRRIDALNEELGFLDGPGTMLLKNIRAGWQWLALALTLAVAYAKWRVRWTPLQISAMALTACVPFFLSVFA